MSKKEKKKNNLKKIKISEFISNKKLDKIYNILQKSSDVDLNYDRIEEILDDDYKVKDLGTNRLVFVSKDKKYKNLIFKVAGDSHGIEANYREFFNGDLDKQLTFSYSISENGVFVVQERVERMTFDIMKDRKKDVRKMLKSLSKKILLVDCKISNFKNFGVRKNGDVCLLDHGDTVPLPKYQGDDIVNINEESCVSLKCKKIDKAVKHGKITPCGGKLKYSKDFDYFICDKCGQMSSINDAYREFYGDMRIKDKHKSMLETEKGFDANKWKEYVRQYCIETMGTCEMDNNKEMGKMNKTKNNESCKEFGDYCIPEPDKYQVLKYNAMKRGSISPKQYLESIGLNPKDYKLSNVNKEFIMNDDNEEENNEMNKFNNKAYTQEDVNNAAEYMINKAIESGEFETIISFDEMAGVTGIDNFDKSYIVGAIRKAVSESDRTRGCIFDNNKKIFSVRIAQNIPILKQKDDVQEQPKVEVDKDEEQQPKKFKLKRRNTVAKREDESETEPVLSTKEEYIKAYAEKHKTTIVEDEEIDDQVPTKLILNVSDIVKNMTFFNGEDCVIVGKYYVPISIIDSYTDDDAGTCALPKKVKKVFKKLGLNPKKYLVPEEETTMNDSDSNTEEVMTEEVQEEEKNDQVHFISATTVIDSINCLISQAISAGDYDDYGFVKITGSDLAQLLVDDIGFTNMGEYYSVFPEDDSISVSDTQLDNIYNTIENMNKIADGDLKTMIDYIGGYIAFEVPSLRKVSDEEESETNDSQEDLGLDKYCISETDEDEYVDEDEDDTYSDEEIDETNDCNDDDYNSGLGLSEEYDNQECLYDAEDDINSYSEENSSIESDIEEEDSMERKLLIETLNNLINAVNSNTEAVKESNRQIMDKLTEMSGTDTEVYEEMACETRKDEILNYRTDTSAFGTTAFIFDVEDIRDKKFVIRNNEGKLVIFDIHNLVCDTYPNIENFVNVTNLEIEQIQ